MRHPGVISNIQVFRDQGWVHGENCLMQPIGNPAMLAHNIEYMLDHPRERARLGRAIGAMQDGYRYEKFCNRVRELVADVVPDKR